MANGAQKFNFVSPGIQVAEIDNSRLPGVRAGSGPVVIGRARRGPALRPITVSSFSEWVEIFGDPVAGGNGGDVWRDGNFLAPIYANYAAQGWLKNQNVLTYVRLLGAEHTDATTAGRAGWQIGSSHNGTLSTGGAFGLFITDEPRTAGNTGSLAAIWYLSEGSIELSGTDLASTAVTGTATLIASQGTDKEFKALIKNSLGTITDTISFNFNTSSKKYIRSVFNTNPTLTNSSITRTAQQKTYFLGETFDRHLEANVTGTAAGGQFATILSLKSGTIDQNDQRMTLTPASTGWFISQDLSSNTGSYDPANMTRLFRLVSHDSAEWEQKNLKISISEIKASLTEEIPYGTFTVEVRRSKDNDNAPEVIERFTQCDLNPNSANYIGKKIGDKKLEWSDNGRRFREFGNYENQSRFFYVDINGDVDAGATNPELLPFGVLGPGRFKGFTVISGAAEAQVLGSPGTNFAGVFAQGNADIVGSKANASEFMKVGSAALTASFTFPTIPLRSTSRVGELADPTEAYFGIDATRTSSTKFERSYVDFVRKLPENLADDPDSDANLEYSFKFSLDDVQPLGSVDAQWLSGSRVAGNSYTAATGTYTSVLDAGFDRFTAPVHGGFDGIDITEKEPFNNRVLLNQGQTTSYEFNSVKRAIDAVADPELVDMNLLTVPGITNTGITDHMVNVSEKRADTLAIIDIEGGFVPSTENSLGDSNASNRGSVTTTVSNLKTRAINTSYAATYYPWIQIRDTETGALIWAPPSVVALGTYASTEKTDAAWIAPAGFTRGGLTQGVAGIPVIGVRERLDKDQRDRLYEIGINPIGKFPNEGIVILGQKTLKAVPSALDRVGPRRMLIFVKKEISKVAATILFDQNIQATWDRFRGLANPILQEVAAGFGLEDFRFILNTSTTTDDLRDRNTLYAKVYLKPAKAIEFIGLDFVITKSGASFDD